MTEEKYGIGFLAYALFIGVCIGVIVVCIAPGFFSLVEYNESMEKNYTDLQSYHLSAVWRCDAPDNIVTIHDSTDNREVAGCDYNFKANHSYYVYFPSMGVQTNG